MGAVGIMAIIESEEYKMTWLDVSGIIGIVVGIIGVITGIIGGKSLTKANKISAKSIQGSNIADTISIINNGSDTYAIKKIAKDITKEELSKIAVRFREIDQRLKAVKKDLESQPKIYSGYGAQIIKNILFQKQIAKNNAKQTQMGEIRHE